MPSYKVHDKIGVTTAITTALFLGTLVEPVITASVVFGVLIGTYLLSPDLDVDSRIDDRWLFLSFIWLPYQKCVKHRSWISHSGPLSATIRLLYLFLPVLLLLYFFAPVMAESMLDFVLSNAFWLVWVYFGVVIADSLHVLADYLL